MKIWNNIKSYGKWIIGGIIGLFALIATIGKLRNRKTVEKIQEKTGNAIVLNTSGGVDNELDIGSKLLQPVIDRSAASNFGQSIKHVNSSNPRLVGEGLETPKHLHSDSRRCSEPRHSVNRGAMVTSVGH